MDPESKNARYADNLVKIDEDSILFKEYFYPFGSKRFPVSNIEEILYYRPKWWSGKWRIYGSGDLKTWCPCDWGRPSRDMMFILFPVKGWWRVGFTVEDSAKAITALREIDVNLREYRGRGTREETSDS